MTEFLCLNNYHLRRNVIWNSTNENLPQQIRHNQQTNN